MIYGDQISLRSSFCKTDCFTHTWLILMWYLPLWIITSLCLRGRSLRYKQAASCLLIMCVTRRRTVLPLLVNELHHSAESLTRCRQFSQDPRGRLGVLMVKFKKPISLLLTPSCLAISTRSISATKTETWQAKINHRVWHGILYANFSEVWESFSSIIRERSKSVWFKRPCCIFMELCTYKCHFSTAAHWPHAHLTNSSAYLIKTGLVDSTVKCQVHICVNISPRVYCMYVHSQVSTYPFHAVRRSSLSCT